VSVGAGLVRPDNPLAEIRLATDAAQGFTLGPDPDHLVRIVPLGLEGDTPPATAYAGQLLFAGARPGADLLVRPAPAGVQTFEQLRDERAPESFAYGLQLASGQTAELDHGMVAIRRDGKLIVQSLPALALDADRRAVPVDLHLDGDVVRLDVAHRNAGY